MISKRKTLVEDSIGMNIIIRLYHDHKKTMLLFIIVGLVSAFVNIGSFTLLWAMMKIDYRISVSIAYVAAVIVHFSLNRNLTFKGRSTLNLHQISKYLTMLAINYCITLFIIRIVVEQLHLSPYVGIVAAIGMTMWISYLLLRYWVFKGKKQNSALTHLIN
jgi:putative flippase GtrA